MRFLRHGKAKKRVRERKDLDRLAERQATVNRRHHPECRANLDTMFCHPECEKDGSLRERTLAALQEHQS